MPLSVESSYYRYTISSFDILLSGNEPITMLSHNIKSFSIEKDFDNDFFPILFMELNLSPDIYYKIMSNKTTVRFRIRLDKFIYDREKEVRFKQSVFNDTFAIYPDENTPFMDEELYKKTKSVTGQDRPMTDFRETYQFYFFKEKDLTASKKVINKILTRANMIQTISYLLSNAGFSNILMTPFDNNSSYSEIILYPISILKNIKYLDNRYGFYNYGRLVFFDYTVGYFIDKRAACTAYKPNEYKDVHINVSKSVDINRMTPGNFKDDSNKYYVMNVNKDNIIMSTASIISNQIGGNSILSVDPNNNGLQTISPNLQQHGASSQQIFINYHENSYTNKSLEYRKLENDNIIRIKFSDVDIDCLAPNKRFIYTFEDTVIQKMNGGDYRLGNTLFNFKKEGDAFSITGTAEFKKIK